MTEHTSLVSTGTSYLITEEWTTVEVLGKAAFQKNSRSPRQRARRTKNQQIRQGIRGPITHYTEESRLQLRKKLHNLPPFTHFGTLTFPIYVPEGPYVKRCIDRLAVWIRRHWNLTMLWKLEFHKSGRPHVMLLLSGAIPRDKLAAEWSSINSKTSRVDLSEIQNYPKVVAYFLKPIDDPQNQVPVGFENVGRFWGVCGPGARPKPLLKIEGPLSAVAPVLRVLRAIYRSKMKLRNPRARPRRDLGFVGRYYWHGGGESVARALERYAIELGLTCENCL